jgi:acetolactate synthase-1/2/3 large subunit
MDWVALASGMGMKAVACDTAETFDTAMAEAMTQKGPRMIVAVLA